MKVDIAIGDNARREIAGDLRAVLADTFALYTKTHSYHWNVVGSDFVQLHTFFEEQYRALWEALDEVAERIRQLGELAPFSAQEMVGEASLKEATGAPAAKEMVRDLLAGHQAVIKTVHKAHRTAEEGSDEASMDLMVERLNFHEKSAWMLRSLAA